ncbi:MAG: anhydro-N-acetylmuramic acid kinase [Rhizomicrobium sp.]
MQNVIGLMSGTSLDGVDAALLQTDGVRVGYAGAALTHGYDDAMRACLRRALVEAAQTEANVATPAIAEAETRLTDAHATAVADLLEKAGLSPEDVALIGFHGQTVLHRPAERRTWQIGDGQGLADATGIDVVADFRKADVAAGGEGAPLVPLYHAALVQSCRDLTLPVAVVNIGGVANVTYVGEKTGAEGAILAFDTGPGNAPIDDWAKRHTGQPVDKDGALAAAGVVDNAVLDQMLAAPFFDRVPPKSLDRFDFTANRVAGLSPADGAATLTAFTAAAIAAAARHFPAPPTVWIICGGGRHNPVLMQELVSRLPVPVLPAEGFGWRGDALEAEAFAFLAARSVRGLPLSLPGTTGVATPQTGGRLFRHS